MFGSRSFKGKIVALGATIHIQPRVNKWIVKSVFWFPIQTHRCTVTSSSTRCSVASKKFWEKPLSSIPSPVFFTRLALVGFSVQVWGCLHVACVSGLVLFTCFVKLYCVRLKSFLGVKRRLHSITEKAKYLSRSVAFHCNSHFVPEKQRCLKFIVLLDRTLSMMNA